MTQDSTDQPPVTPPIAEPVPPAPPADPSTPETDSPAPPTSAGLPSWLPYLAIAVVPALIVGILVYFVASNSAGGSTSPAGALDGFLRFSASDDLTTYEGALPPDFPDDFPLYSGVEVIASFSIPSQEGTTYFVALASDDSIDDVYNFYLERLEESPWQMELATAGGDGTGVVFSRPDNADINGQISLVHSEVDDQTLAYVYYQDLGQTSDPEEEPFVLQPSRPLPPGFPTDIPIYGDDDSVVIDTLLQKSGGNNNFLISFLTEESNVDVVEFYRSEFSRRGWNVTDAAAEATSFSIGIDFNDGTQGQISGSVSADTFEDDSDYTRVDMVLEVSARRPRGN